MADHNVLITGSTSLLGTALLRQIPENTNVVATTLSPEKLPTYKGHTIEKLDITDDAAVAAMINQVKPTAVIHAASLGNVDYCEQHQDEALAVNVKGTESVLRACEQVGAHFIFTSSNAIYDGLHAPYAEDAQPAPLNFYGKTKVMSEQTIMQSPGSWSIARLILMYGWNHPSERTNPVTWLIEKLRNNESVKMVNDTYTNPLYNEQAAQAIWAMVTGKKQGAYQIAGKERINRYDFAVKTAQIFELDQSLIESVGSDYFSGIAKRMPDTTYDTTKMATDLGVTPLSIEEGLQAMKENLEHF